jgi:hypothetical protein
MDTRKTKGTNKTHSAPSLYFVLSRKAAASGRSGLGSGQQPAASKQRLEDGHIKGI